MLPLEEQIRNAFQSDQSNDRIVYDADEIPIDFDRIGNDWLTAHLCKGVPGSAVVEHQLGPPDDGTNNRRRIYLTYNSIGRVAGLPTSIFAKATSGLRNRLMLAHSGAIHCEVTFFREIREALEIETPHVFHANYDPHGFNSIILLEDLGDCAFLDLEKHGSPELMQRQLALLANLHASGARNCRIAARLGMLPSWKKRFTALMQVNLAQACSDGLHVCRDVIPHRLWERRREIWPATIASLDAPAAGGPVLCHGDVHLHNWYNRPDGTLGISDWGVAHNGPWGRDLAYCLATGLSTEDRRTHEQALIAGYIAGLAERGGPKLSFEDASMAMRAHIMTALAFWTMTAAPVAEMPDMQPADTALAFVNRLASAVDDWNALDV